MKKLYRSTRDRKLWGICGGLAEMTGWDATLLRILLIIITILTHGAALFVYLISGFVIPKSPEPPYGLAGATSGDSWNAWTPPASSAYGTSSYSEPNVAPSSVDRAMAEMETKALRKELEAMRHKIEKFEKGDK